MENREEFIIDIRVEGEEVDQAEDDEDNNKLITGRRKFKQFDIITADDDDHDDNSIKDHHYYASFWNHSSQTNKRIMKEWKILEESLPTESIYVRAYESRIDFLRAVIIGAAGTPYKDGLFFFDIQFPSDYPNQPPKVYYQSFGFRLNPNLYPNGKVCLSLPKTYHYREGESWNPSESTLLQVLVSIQALVLNAKPYYNAHAHPTSGSLSYSLAYNEDAFVLTYKTMLALLNRPPRHFEEFVAQHFRERAETILEACKTYIADHSKDNSGSSSSLASSMRTVYPKLVQAFIKNGSSLENYERDTKYMDDNSGYNKIKQVLLMMIYCPLLCILLFYFWVFVTILMMCYENVYLKK